MKQYSNKEIRDFIKCPQFGDIKYGKWGSLRLDVRQTLLNLINVNDSMDYIIKQQYQELRRKDNIINGIKKELNKNYNTYVCKNKSYGKTFKSGAEVYKEHLLYKLNELEGDNK